MTVRSDIRIIAVTPRSVTALLRPSDARFTLEQPLRWQLAQDGQIVQHGIAKVVPLFLDRLEPETTYVLALPDLGDEVQITTSACAGMISVRDYGADPCLDDNSGAFANATAMLPKGGTLLVPRGHYVSGPIFLRSDMVLHLANGATLASRPDRDHWPILPAHHDDGRVLGSWEGVAERSYAALLTAIDARNVTITGSGTIDGGGDRGDWWSWPKECRNGARRARTIYMTGCDDVIISGVKVCNSPSWTIHPHQCNNVTAAALRIENPPDSPNTDGLNPESCQDVLIAGLHFTVGDDCIAIKAGKRSPNATDPLLPTRNIDIRNSRMERGHGAVVLGSEMSGGIEDVRIARCEFVGTDRGLRIKTRRGRGGYVRNITLSDCTMSAVQTPIAVNAFYFCDADGRTTAVQDRNPAPVDDTTPRIENITVTNVSATDVHHAVGAFLGLPEAPISSVRLHDVTWTYADAAVAAPPLMACNVDPVRHAEILSEFVEVVTSGLHCAATAKEFV